MHAKKKSAAEKYHATQPPFCNTATGGEGHRWTAWWEDVERYIVPEMEDRIAARTCLRCGAVERVPVGRNYQITLESLARGLWKSYNTSWE